MTALETALRQICVDLTESHSSFALVGGLAVSTRTEPRFTRDADIAVAVLNDAEAESLVRTLLARGYQVGALVEQDAVDRIATVRLTRSPGPVGPVLDLLFASSGIEPEVVAAAEAIELLPSLRIGVATTGHLIALKVLSRDDVERPQDLVDLRALLGIASDAELVRARNALTLIGARRYHRGRDLMSEMDSLRVDDRFDVYNRRSASSAHMMTPYGSGRDTGVVAYEIGSDWIRCQFSDGSTYLYNGMRPGAHHVEKMKALALGGRGLTTYINQHVRTAYARHER